MNIESQIQQALRQAELFSKSLQDSRENEANTLRVLEEERLRWSQNTEEKSVIIEQLERELEATVDALKGDPSKFEQMRGKSVDNEFDQTFVDKEFDQTFRNSESKSVYASWNPVDFSETEQVRSAESYDKDVMKSEGYGNNQLNQTKFVASNDKAMYRSENAAGTIEYFQHENDRQRKEIDKLKLQLKRSESNHNFFENTESISIKVHDVDDSIESSKLDPYADALQSRLTQVQQQYTSHMSLCELSTQSMQNRIDSSEKRYEEIYRQYLELKSRVFSLEKEREYLLNELGILTDSPNKLTTKQNASADNVHHQQSTESHCDSINQHEPEQSFALHNISSGGIAGGSFDYDDLHSSTRGENHSSFPEAKSHQKMHDALELVSSFRLGKEIRAINQNLSSMSVMSDSRKDYSHSDRSLIQPPAAAVVATKQTKKFASSQQASDIGSNSKHTVIKPKKRITAKKAKDTSFYSNSFSCGHVDESEIHFINDFYSRLKIQMKQSNKPQDFSSLLGSSSFTNKSATSLPLSMTSRSANMTLPPKATASHRSSSRKPSAPIPAASKAAAADIRSDRARSVSRERCSSVGSGSRTLKEKRHDRTVQSDIPSYAQIAATKAAKSEPSALTRTRSKTNALVDGSNGRHKASANSKAATPTAAAVSHTIRRHPSEKIPIISPRRKSTATSTVKSRQKLRDFNNEPSFSSEAPLDVEAEYRMYADNSQKLTDLLNGDLSLYNFRFGTDSYVVPQNKNFTNAATMGSGTAAAGRANSRRSSSMPPRPPSRGANSFYL